jgi:hypothetical protein
MSYYLQSSVPTKVTSDEDTVHYATTSMYLSHLIPTT